MDFIYLKQHFYIKVGWIYIKSTYNYYVVYKFSKPDLFIFVDLAANSRSL